MLCEQVGYYLSDVCNKLVNSESVRSTAHLHCVFRLCDSGAMYQNNRDIKSQCSQYPSGGRSAAETSFQEMKIVQAGRLILESEIRLDFSCAYIEYNALSTR